jgi:hypothetical protein
MVKCGRAPDKSTYDYLQPTPKQLGAMQRLRQAVAVYGTALAELLPDGLDKDHASPDDGDVG